MYCANQQVLLCMVKSGWPNDSISSHGFQLAFVHVCVYKGTCTHVVHSDHVRMCKWNHNN